MGGFTDFIRTQEQKPQSFTDFVSAEAKPTEPEGPGLMRRLGDVAQRGSEIAQTHAIKSIGGATAEEAYDAAGQAIKHGIERTMGPYQQVREKLPILKVAEAVGGFGRIVPKTLDFFYTPMGAATLAGLPKAPLPVRSGAGSYFGTEMTRGAGEEIKHAAQEPTPANIGSAAGAVAMAALPLAHAGRTVQRTRQMAQQKPVIEPEPQPVDAGPVRKGGPVYPAVESAETLSQVATPFKSARESAEVFASAKRLPEFPPPMNRSQRQASVMPPETGVPETVARAQDARERIAPQVAGKPLAELSNSERLVVDDLITEQNALQSRGAAQRGSFSFMPLEKKTPAVPLEEEYMNFRRIRVSPAEEANLRTEVKTAVEQQGLDPKMVEPHSAIVEAARTIDPELVQHVGKTDIQTRAARYAMRQRMNTLNREVVSGRQKLIAERDRMTPDDAMALEQKLNEQEANLREYIGQWAGIRSADGRNLAMHRILSDSTWDVAYWVDRARKASGLPPGTQLPPEVDSGIRSIIAEGEAAGAAKDGVAMTKARQKLAKRMAKLEQSGWWETLTALRKAGLLTGVKTHARNIGGNAAFQVMEEVARVPGALTDIALSTFSKQRTTAGTSMRGIVNAGRTAATKGVREAGQVMRQGATDADLQKMDLPRELNSRSKVVNGYVNTVFRTLGAEDRIFRSYAIRRSLEAQAKVQAINEARQGLIPRKNVIRRASQLVENPTETMATQAIADAEFATFNNKNLAASGVSMARAGIKSAGERLAQETGTEAPKHAADALVFGFDMVVPFVRTPSNILARVSDYTVGAPVKVVYHGAMAMAKGLTPARQRAISEAIGRGSVGAGLLLLGYSLAEKGEATGVGAQTPGERAVAESAGRQPGSVLFGGEWKRIQPFAPAGNLIVTGASLYEQGTRPLKDELKRPGNIAAVATRSVLEQPMLEGTRDIVQALESPGARGQRAVASMASSAIPTLASDIGTLVDPTRRDPKGVVEAVAARQPFTAWRESVAERTDVFGQPLESRREAAVNALLPTTAKEKNDPVFRELIRLKVSTDKPTKQAGETDDIHRLRSDIRGRLMLQNIRDVVSDSRYSGLDDNTKKDAIERAIDGGQRDATGIIRDERYVKAAPEQKLAILQRIRQSLDTNTVAATR